MILRNIAEIFAKKPVEDNTEKLRTLQLAKIREEIAMAEDIFNLSEDDNLVEAAIYKLQSLQYLQRHLISECKEGKPVVLAPDVISNTI